MIPRAKRSTPAIDFYFLRMPDLSPEFIVFGPAFNTHPVSKPVVWSVKDITLAVLDLDSANLFSTKIFFMCDPNDVVIEADKTLEKYNTWATPLALYSSSRTLER